METNNQTNPNNVITPQPVPPPGSNKENIMIMAILCYLGILVLIPLLTAKDDPFVKFHIKQGLVLLIAFIISSALYFIPVLGWLLWVATLVLMIFGIINAVNGQQKELPVIGQFAKNFHI